jgi:hypothetical protein
MRLFVFTTSWWENHDHAWAQALTLNKWLRDVEYYFKPWHVFVACGTWSSPIHSPLPNHVPIINGGIKKNRPYNSVWWNYAGTAIGAALAYSLTRCEWDALIMHDTDALIGAVDFDALLKEFIERPETFLCSQWHGRPGGGSITAWKPAAAVKWLNQRRRANFIERTPDTPQPMLLEDEMREIHKGEWWCPWQLPTMRQDFGFESEVPEREPLEKAWPFVRLPNPAIVEEYMRTQTSRAKPVLADSTLQA